MIREIVDGAEMDSIDKRIVDTEGYQTHPKRNYRYPSIFTKKFDDICSTI
jgi:hypothetical protein